MVNAKLEDFWMNGIHSSKEIHEKSKIPYYYNILETQLLPASKGYMVETGIYNRIMIQNTHHMSQKLLLMKKDFM